MSDAVLSKVDYLVEKYRLRGFDAIHMASAIVLAKRFKDEDLLVACWDAELWDFFAQEKFLLIPENRPGQG